MVKNWSQYEPPPEGSLVFGSGASLRLYVHIFSLDETVRAYRSYTDPSIITFVSYLYCIRCEG